jgi:DNA-binding NarL/FixJ family response regulator
MTNEERQRIEQKLLADLQDAKRLYHACMADCESARQQFGGMLDHPDGTAALHTTATRERLALQRYRAARNAYNNFVLEQPLPRRLPDEAGADLEVLTPREKEVLTLIASGLTTKKAAAQLGVSFKTVVTHRTRIMAKLNIHNVIGLLKYAIRQKLIDP